MRRLLTAVLVASLAGCCAAPAFAEELMDTLKQTEGEKV